MKNTIIQRWFAYLGEIDKAAEDYISAYRIFVETGDEPSGFFRQARKSPYVNLLSCDKIYSWKETDKKNNRQNQQENKNQKNSKPITHNRQFHKRRTAIFVAILKLLRKTRGCITIMQLAKAAGFPRQVFYRYYKNVNQAVADFEKSLHQEYRQYLDQVSSESPDGSLSGIPGEKTNQKLFLHTFIYMAQNKEIFYQICSDMALQDILYRMLLEDLYPRLRLARPPKGGTVSSMGIDREDIYLRVLTGIISQWGKKTKCDVGKARPYIRAMTEEGISKRNM